MKLFAATVSIPIGQMMVLLFIAAYPIGMWFTAFLMAKDFMPHGEVNTDMKFIIFLLSLFWPLVIVVLSGMWILPRLWNLCVKLYGRLPTCLRKALYWMQFVVRPVHLAEVLN